MPRIACAHEGCTRVQYSDDMFTLGGTDEVPYNNQRRVCHSCYLQHYGNCSCCNTAFLRNDLTSITGYIFCSQCQQNHFIPCEVCQTMHWNQASIAFNDDDGVRHIACSRQCDQRLRRNCEECGRYHLLPFTQCLTKYPPLPTEYVQCYLPNRVFSVELETKIAPNAPKGWKAVQDGSIGGLEYLSGPIVGAKAIEHIETGCEFFNKDGPCVDNRCGFHLHINARDKTEEQLAKFIMTCYKYQQDFYNMVPKRRRGCDYSRNLAAGFEHCRNGIEELLYKPDDDEYDRSETLRSHKRNKYHQSRYYWVNLHSYYYRGTVEIRLHSGTTLPEKVLRWTEMWLKVFDWSTSNDFNPTLLGSKTIWGILKRAGVRKSTIDFYRERTELFSPKVNKEKELKEKKEREILLSSLSNESNQDIVYPAWESYTGPGIRTIMNDFS